MSRRCAWFSDAQVRIMPAVQKPHWKPLRIQKRLLASDGCRSGARPSIVVTSWTVARKGRDEHYSTRSPSINDLCIRLSRRRRSPS